MGEEKERRRILAPIDRAEKESDNRLTTPLAMVISADQAEKSKWLVAFLTRCGLPHHSPALSVTPS